jgi:hypothetical protein
MKAKGLLALLLGSLLVACSSCETNEVSTTATGDSPQVAAESPTPAAAQADSGVYSRYNIHYYVRGSSNLASYANYTDCPGHSFLPYNTKFRVGSSGSGFRLTAVDTGMRILFEYKSANMQGMPEKEYLSTIMSPTPVEYEGLNAQDQEGIRAGKAIVGMTKQGVMIALGYPAKHRTPSTDSNTWVYWKGRFNMLTVNFGPDGKVASIM